ncbi:MAG: Arm DNA-binding domain-containing protein [Cyclobacteriaceae bacterium]
MRSNKTFGIAFFVKKHRLTQGKVPIYVRIIVNRKRVDLSIKRKVAVDHWDEWKGAAKGNREDIQALNHYLEQVRNQLFECHRQLE